MLATAAIKMPGRLMGTGRPPGEKPLTGDSPPLPGKYRMTSPTQMPATSSGTSGHQIGVEEKPTADGIEVNVHP